MASFSRGFSRFRLPRPKSCLGIMPLSIATECIAVSLIFNKLTGFYGVLAIFTGYALNPFQISQYLLSLLCLIALVCILPHIRKGTPFPNLAFAWIYVLDTILSTAYTAVFAVTWCLANSQAPLAEGDIGGSVGLPPTGDAGEFIEPRQDGGRDQQQQYVASMAARETVTSLVLVGLFDLVRIYFCFVVMAYARLTLRRYVHERQGVPHAAGAAAGAAHHDDDDIDDDTTAASGEVDMEKDIFAVGGQLGDGWRGKLGRVMVAVGRGYWLGSRKEDEEWARNVGSKFRGSRAV